MTKPTEHDAHRAFHESILGCHGDCEWGEPCTCSHASAPRRPRQPRLPAPRTPRLPLLKRLSIRWQALRAAWERRERWAWVDCRAHQDGWCCHSYRGPHADEFLGCEADRRNDWVAARFWRRWVATLRERL